MIKSSKLSILNSNTHRIDDVNLFIKEYHRLHKYFIDILWDLKEVPRLFAKKYTKGIDTWLSQRAIQACSKQASGTVRSARNKQEQRIFKYNEFVEKGMFKKARKLKKIIDKVIVSKPEIKTTQPELDYRFIKKIDFNNNTSFDGWISLKSLGNNLKIILPVKKTKHFNWLNSRGIIRKGIRISNSKVTFIFDIPDPPQKDTGSTIGLDVGIKNVFSTSDKQQSSDNPHGWNLTKIQDRLSRKKRGSKAFEKTQSLRENYVNWSINQLNLDGVKTLKLENIKHLRRNCRSSRLMSHWTYTTIFDKLEDYCLEHGVRVEKMSPTYTSQRCSQCGWTRKSNRKGKSFKCKSCSYECDADLNASINIGLELPTISKQQRLKRLNIKGFYWNVNCQEPIVPDVQKGQLINYQL